MIAAILAGLAALQPLPDVGASRGDWLLVTVHRVIAPDQIPGQCFLQARIDEVVNGHSFRTGDAVAISVACRPGGLAPAAAVRGVPAVPTIETLRSQKRALVHLDAGGRVLDNGYYGLGAPMPITPGIS
jgi:hypothetical protein